MFAILDKKHSIISITISILSIYHISPISNISNMNKSRSLTWIDMFLEGKLIL